MSHKSKNLNRARLRRHQKRDGDQQGKVRLPAEAQAVRDSEIERHAARVRRECPPEQRASPATSPRQ